jgi:proline iminopeptidase
MRVLYPPSAPYQQGKLPVSDLHTLYFEQVGNPEGRPIVFLHGGPGGGIEPIYRQYFDPKLWRVVLFDQRGCGQSTPHAELRENTTWDLVADIERLRVHLGIERWTVFGGSWGSALALAYSQTHPERCTGLILRGIFMLRRKELLWFYQEGASYIFPEAWEGFLAPIPAEERHDLLSAYHKRLTSPDKQVKIQAAHAWSRWEAATCKLYPDQDLIEKFTNDKFAEAFACIENHYFIQGGFFEQDEQLLRDVDKIRHIPAVIVQGRYDAICPFVSAWELHRAWPESQLIVVPDAGHSMTEPAICSALLEATDRFAHDEKIP